jgi:mevalonate kinase
LSPENAEKLEEAAKDISKAALVHHTAMQQDELKVIIEERDLLYKENEIYHDSLERVLEENKNLRTLIEGWKKFRG